MTSITTTVTRSSLPAVAAILREMTGLAAIVTTAAAATAPPARAGLLLFERSAAGSGDLDGFGLAVGSLSDHELDQIVDG